MNSTPSKTREAAEKEREKVRKLKLKRDQFNARIQKLEASEKLREKKRDTRRKILVGAYIIDMAKLENKLEILYQNLDLYLTRDSDRVLFNLPALNTASPKNHQDNSDQNNEFNPPRPEDIQMQQTDN